MTSRTLQIVPWRDAADSDAWLDLDDAEHARVWDLVYDRFAFRPSTRSSEWPSFREPAGSFTWDISAVWVDLKVNEYRATHALLEGLRAVCGTAGFVYALDWQHTGYRFLPDRGRPAIAEDSWLVPALPNGDYYLFLAVDLRFGWVGHPWEETICAFGPLADTLRPALDELGWPLVRVDGRPAR